jgi:3D (Asp-Asp-Asp) domain-containing protein
MNKNWERIVQIVCLVVLVVSLIVSGFVHISERKNNEALSLELSDNKTLLANTQDELTIVTNELNATKENLQAETEKTAGLNDELAKLQTEFEDISEELEVANTTIDDLKGVEYKLVYLGDYKLTHYCHGFHGEPCGTGDGLTATGTKVTAGRTIAVDPKVIPYGTKVYIEGYGWRVAEDCGGGVKGNHIDIAMGSHDEAMSKGVKHRGVWLLVKK